MGFFNWIGRGLGRAIEIVGDVFDSEKLKEIGKNIYDNCDDTSRYVSETDSYDKDKARLEETENVNNILSDFSLKIENKADLIEKIAIKESRVYFEELKNELMESSKDTGINVKKIERNMNKVESEIKGKLKNYISKRVSIDDEKCLEILKMDAGIKKEHAMRKFSENILKEGLNNLVKDIKIVIKDQSEIINETVEEKLEDIKSNLNKQAGEFKVLEDSKHKTESEINSLKDELKVKIELSKACIKALN